MAKITDNKRQRDMAVGIYIGHIIGDAINELNGIIANDAAGWITTKKKGKGGGGKRFLIDSQTGVILKGGPKRMQGKTFKTAFKVKKKRKTNTIKQAKSEAKLPIRGKLFNYDSRLTKDSLSKGKSFNKGVGFVIGMLLYKLNRAY